MSKLTVLVVFGGRSAEHDISIITAHTPIIDCLRKSDKYDVLALYISKTGNWYSDPALLEMEYFRRDDFETAISKLPTIQLSLNDGLSIIWPGLIGKREKIDVVFPATHGTYGEDGSLMGLLRMAGVPFVGCDLEASVIAMDKVLTKQVADANNLATVKFISFWKHEWMDEADQIIQKAAALQFPVFVKPAHLGSSIAITKVKTSSELANAVEVALFYDDRVLIEESIENLQEVTVPVMGNHKPQAAMVEQPANTTEFFNFEDKYMGGKSDTRGANSQYSIIPAPLADALTTEVKALAVRIFEAIGGSGIARIDFLIDKSNSTIYLNEINPLPGSLYHHNWRKAGISPEELVQKLIELALERHADSAKITRTFKTDVLKQASRPKFE